MQAALSDAVQVKMSEMKDDSRRIPQAFHFNDVMLGCVTRSPQALTEPGGPRCTPALRCHCTLWHVPERLGLCPNTQHLGFSPFANTSESGLATDTFRSCAQSLRHMGFRLMLNQASISGNSAQDTEWSPLKIEETKPQCVLNLGASRVQANSTTNVTCTSPINRWLWLTAKSKKGNACKTV